MKSKEFINEGVDKSPEDVKKNHPEVYKFLNDQIGYMALERATVDSYNTHGNHFVRVMIKPSAGLGNTIAGLDNAGINYQVIDNPMGLNPQHPKSKDKVVTGKIGDDINFSIRYDGKAGNTTETWSFGLPLADPEDGYYKDRTMEEAVDDGANTETKFRTRFADNDVLLHSVQVTDYDDDWIRVSAKGVEHFRAGTQEKIQFVLRCWWNPVSDEMHGTVLSQGSSHDTKYSKELEMEDDQLTLAEFAHRVDTFVSDIAINQRDRYNKGEADYWAKGGRGMMPGKVKKDNKY